MKKIIALISLMAGTIWSVFSQETTSYGVSAGTGGSSNSYFGFQTGQQSGSSSSTNTAMGHKAMRYNIDGIFNTAIGASTLLNGGDACTAVGSGALSKNNGAGEADPGVTNTAVGVSALNWNFGGDNNTAVGAGALNANQSGSYNTAQGTYALYGNFDGDNNTATGDHSLYTNNGSSNTANGYRSLYANHTGNYNAAMGAYSMNTNTTGYHNTANGYSSLYSNTTGYYNTALGSRAMYSNTSGNFNTATGYYALYSSNSGTHNAAGGFRALYNNTGGSYNTAKGAFALDNISTGSYNSALGYNAGPATGAFNNTTAIGYLAVPTASNQVRIGNTAVTSIGGQVSWTTFSDGRFKKDIKEDVSGLEFVNHLRPVSYIVDRAEVNKFLHVSDNSANQPEARTHNQRQTGFVAQEVEAIVKKTGYVFYGVDVPKNENDHYGIRYAEFVVPLVKAIQELSAIIKEHEKKDDEQQKQIESLLMQLGSKGNNAFQSKAAVLFQNNPNPFDAETAIEMTLPDNVANASIMVYNLEGKQLKNIDVSERGDVRVDISANELPAGMYLYSLIVDGKIVDTKRMVLTK